MSTLSLRLPESLHNELRELSKREGISINQLAASALGEKMAALMTQDYLEEKAKRGSRKKFDRALAKVKKTKSDSHDQL
jgi:hypothetical protein